MENIRSMNIRELLNREILCDCGTVHKVNFFLKSEQDFLSECERLTSGKGKIYLVSENNLQGFCEDLGNSLKKNGYSVEYFCKGWEDYGKPDDIRLLIVVGGEDVINREKDRAYRYGLPLMTFPLSLNYLSVSDNTCRFDYDGIKIERVVKAPDSIIVSPKLFLYATEQEYISCLCEIFSKATTVCDYAYRKAISDRWCKGLIDAVFSCLEKVNTLSFDRRIDCVEKVMEECVKLSAYLSFCGIEKGGESQLSDTLTRFGQSRERGCMKKGEILFLSSVIVCKIYSKFLSKTVPYGVCDGFFDMNQGRIILKMQESEVVKLGRGEEENYKYKDYKIGLFREDLSVFVERASNILKTANGKIKRAYSDGGFHTRYFLTAGEALSVIPLSSFYSKGDSLLAFIKDRGLLEFAKSV